MKTTKVVLLVLMLGIVVVAPALLLVSTARNNQEFVRDLAVDLVVSNVDGHPTIDALIENVPQDCMKCHNKDGKWAPSYEFSFPDPAIQEWTGGADG